ncbi:MAG: alpha/beta fold hydrolase [Polyangiales bacterium]
MRDHVYERHRINSKGTSLMAYTCGDPSRPPVVLVHGYPDDHSVWDSVVAHLKKDFFVVTYDVRGAGASDHPERQRDYRLSVLSRDLVAVLDHVVPNRAVHLVGHDWGSIQSWESVTDPSLRDRFLSYTSLSGPCLDHVG